MRKYDHDTSEEMSTWERIKKAFANVSLVLPECSEKNRVAIPLPCRTY